MTKLLLVEDDPNLQDQLLAYLSNENFRILQSYTLKEAQETLRQQSIDLIILDWNLPDGSGIDLLTGGFTGAIPVLFLTARNDLTDKIVGLEVGAVDYITKPFEPRELLARIRTQLKRRTHQTDTNQTLTLDDFEINKSERWVKWKGALVQLTRKEFDLLLLLLQSKGKVFSRDELLNLIWGFDEYPTTRTVDNHILKLRKLFDESLFETVRGVGYRFKRGPS